MDIRKVVGGNVQRLMDYAADHGSPYGDQRSLAAKAKVSMSTVARIRKAQVAPGVDVLERIAGVYRLQAWQLLIPDLDPTNPPVFAMTATERDLYRNLRAAAQQLAAANNHTQ